MFLKYTIQLIKGTFISQIVVFSFSPILTRLYAPSDFGALGIYIAITSILGTVLSLRYELSFPLIQKNKNLRNMFWMCVIISSIVTCLISMTTYIYEDIFLYVEELKNIPFYLIVMGALLFSFVNILTYLCVRLKNFNAISNSRVVQSLLCCVTQVSLFSFDQIGLLVGVTIGQISFICITFFRKSIKLPFNFSFQNYLDLARKYKDFPKYSTLSGLVNTVGSFMPHFGLCHFYGSAYTGFYLLSHRVLSLPLNFFGQSIGKVFHSYGKQMINTKVLDVFFVKMVFVLSSFVFIPILINFLYSPFLFSTVFGQQWLHSGICARWLSMMVFFQFLVSPLSTIFGILQKQRIGLYLQINLAVLRSISIVFGCLYFDFITTIKMFSIFSAIGYLAYLFVIPIYVTDNGAKLISELFHKTFLMIKKFTFILLALFIAFIVEDMTLKTILNCLSLLLISRHYIHLFKSDDYLFIKNYST